MNDIVMPKLSDTMTEGRLVSWKKQVGEAVQRGDILAEVETDKANMELEAFSSGVILEIRVKAGETVQIGTVIAVIGTAEEKGAPSGTPPPKKTPAPAAAQAHPSQVAPLPGGSGHAPPGPNKEDGYRADAKLAGEAAYAQSEPPTEAALPAAAQVHVPPGAMLADKGAPAAAAVPGSPLPGIAGTSPDAGSGAHGKRAAPMVRRRARELGIDLGEVEGSGPEGRIVLQDLVGEFPQTAHGAPAEAAPPPGTPLPLSRLRSAIARTVALSWQTIPHFSVTAEAVMDDAEALLRQLKGCGVEVTLNDLIVKGAASALLKFPLLNASFAGGGVTLQHRVNIGVAVAVPDGVLVPVIADCQRLTLQEVALSCRLAVGRARSGELREEQMSGGTFSVSNLGRYGVQQFSAIIYPSQVAILAVGAASDAVVARGGVAVCVRLMKLTLSADHRVVDGAYAAQFLAEVKEMLENPVRLLIEPKGAA